MTIAICVKVHDGVVLAADSASTLVGVDPSTGRQQTEKVWLNASKVFNARKGLPIGIATWDVGAIGEASISTLIKDLRRRFTGDEGDSAVWRLDPADYTVERVARLVRQFMYDETYRVTYGKGPITPSLGFFVAGYSVSRGARAPHAEVYRIEIDKAGQCSDPKQIFGSSECGIDSGGYHEGVRRLLDGFSPGLGDALAEITEKGTDVGAIIAALQKRFAATFAQPPMPIRDAIELAIFLGETAAGFSRFSEGQAVVGGEIEVAAITKHESFKWVRRKYYFDRALNPDRDEFVSEVSASSGQRPPTAGASSN